MKKRFIIILVIQSVIILLMFVYAFIQKLEADKNLMEAVRQEQIAVEATILVEKLRAELGELKEEKTQSK